MPLKLIPPKAGRSPNYTIRGTYLRQYIERSTGTSEKKIALRVLSNIKAEIERGGIATPGRATFASAALAYMQAGGETRFVEPLLRHFGECPLTSIDQAAIDAAATAIYPSAMGATRNRQVYSPMSAILKRAGVSTALKRPVDAAGTARLVWLDPADANRLLEAARCEGELFGALCTFLLYTGARLSEALAIRPADLRLQELFALLQKTKNGAPRPVHLPPTVTDALTALDLTGRTVFRMTKCGRLYSCLNRAAVAANVTIPDGVAFHIFRHTYGAWMRRYAGLDTTGLVGTGAWKSRQAAAVYEHADVSEEGRKADLLPTRGNIGGRLR